MWPHRLEVWRTFFESAAAATGLDPTLIAAVCDRESLGGVGLKPPGPSGTGDNGHGRGLMQIDDRAFPSWCSDATRWQDPARNIMFGAQLLAQNLEDLDGNIPAALAAYNAGLGRVERLMGTISNPTIKDFDSLTTGRNYCSDTLERQVKLKDADNADPPLPGAA